MSLLDYVENGPVPTTSGFGFQPSIQPLAPSNTAFSKVIKGPNSSTDDPIFSLDKIQFNFPGDIVCASVSNNILCCALEPMKSPSTRKDVGRIQKLVLIDLDREDGDEELTFATKTRDDQVYNTFISPSGSHIIISFHSGDNYYLHTSWKQPKLLTKIKAVRIQSIAWCEEDPNRDSTGPILVGSNQGHLYETEISTSEGANRKLEKYFVQLLSVSGGALITGIEYIPLTDLPGSYVVYMSTPNRLFHMTGRRRFEEDGSSLGEISSSFGNTSEFQEIPGKPRSSRLLLMPSFHELDGDAHFCWTTEPGLFQGVIQLANASIGESTFTSTVLLPFPNTRLITSDTTPLKIPLSISMAQFHYLLLYDRHLVMVNSIDGSVYSVHQLMLNENERLQGLFSDRAKNSFWLYSNLSLYEIIVEEEDRDVWRIFASKKDFASASRFVKTDDQRDAVEREWAEWLFSRGQFEASASHYAASSLPLEEVALRFLNLNETEALKSFLLGRLKQYRKSDITQVTVLGLWILDLMAEKLDELEVAEKRLAVSLEDTQDETRKADLKAELSRVKPQVQRTRKEIHQFLIEHKDSLHRKTVYEVLESHGRHHDAHVFAETVGDWDPVLRTYIDHSEWNKALDVLSRQNSLDLYYKYSPEIIIHVPKETINLWIKTSELNPRKLMTAMLACERCVDDGDVHLTRYLQHVLRTIGVVQDRVLENLLVRLLIKSASREDEAHILAYINSQKDNPFFDLRYTLRQCQSKGLVQSCVQIYSFLGLHDEAVSLALKNADLDLARLVADRLEGNEEGRKQLWLNIAKHVIEKESDLKRGLQIMAEGNLKMEQILPFFPDFVLIDAFKEELCAVLRQYNEKIDTLKVELEESIKCSELIRGEMNVLQNRHAVVPVKAFCCLCKKPLFSRQFYVFPCEHVYHFDCLVDENIRWSVRGRRIKELRSLLSQTPSSVANGAIAAPAESIKRTKWKTELDDLVSAECALCGDMIIRTLDRPFVSEDDVF